MPGTAKLRTQLRTLIQLTQAEIQIAEARIPQARTESVGRELERNARNGRERVVLLQRTLRELGGVPDVVGPVLGRVGALLKAPLEHGAPLDEVLLADLALEQQLLDRARYLKVLAETAEQPKVVKIADRLVTAHSGTVDWLRIVLAEHALGGPVALRATPLQRAAGGAALVLNLPARIATHQVNRAVENIAQGREQVRTKLSETAGKATQLTAAAREVLTVGRDASLHRVESLAREDGAIATAESVHAARREAGALSAPELPLKKYDTLYAQDAVKAIKALRTAEDVRAVLRYEETNAGRSSVVRAAQAQVAALAREAADIA